MDLFSNKSAHPKVNAQANLQGRTHYVDDDTLRFHHSRVLVAKVIDNGLLFGIVTSDAKDMNNTERGFRYVIFDIFGTVVERNPKSINMEWFPSSARALKAMWAAVNEMDAQAITAAAIENAERHHALEMKWLRERVAKLAEKVA